VRILAADLSEEIAAAARLAANSRGGITLAVSAVSEALVIEWDQHILAAAFRAGT
jgi:hypothetical protein